MIPETTAEVKEGLITRYSYEISPGKNKSKLTLFMGLSWVAVTNHVTIGKIIEAGLKLRAGWRSLHPINEAWTALFTEHGKKLVFVDVRPGKPTPKPDIAPRTVPLIDYVSWQSRAMLKINDPDVGTIFLERNDVLTDAGLPTVPSVTKVEGWSVSFERCKGVIELLHVHPPSPVIAPVIPAPFKPMVFPLMLPAPTIAGLLPAPQPQPPATDHRAKMRRYERRLPARALIGENRYAITTERWLELDRANRHAVMRALDPLILDAIMYASGKRTIHAFGAGWEEFRRRMITVRSIVLRNSTHAAPFHKADDEYAKIVAANEAERAAKLKELVRQLLAIDIEPTSGEAIMPMQADGTRFTYQLSRIGDTDELRVLLWSPALGMNQVSETITVKAQVETALQSLWKRHNAMADRQMQRRAQRDQAVEQYFPEHAQQGSRYVQ